MARFQLIGGQHQTTVPVRDAGGKIVGETLKTFVRGDVVESDEPLDAQYVNKFRQVQDGGRVEGGIDLTPEEVEIIQHRRASAGTVPRSDLEVDLGRSSYAATTDAQAKAVHTTMPQSAADLEAQLNRMNVQQLREMASAEEIDLKGAKTKDEMVKVIKAAY